MALQQKVEKLQEELSQSYRSNAAASQQLLQMSTTLQAVKEDADQKGRLVLEFGERLEAARAKIEELEVLLREKDAAVNLAAQEAARCREEVQEVNVKMKEMEGENRMLIDRWMELKMQDAERINEANAIYEDMMERSKAGRLEELARGQVDGIVRRSEAGAEAFVAGGVPSKVRHTLVHDGGCSTLTFDLTGARLFSGGHDRLVRVWEGTREAKSILRGCLGAVLDLKITRDDRCMLGASSDSRMYLWDIASSRIRHSLTGHTEKVVAVDTGKIVVNRAVSAAHDRTLKVWDLEKGYGISTLVCHSNCNSICLNTDESAVCSAHMDGNLRIWDLRSGRLSNEVASHASVVTCAVLSRSGTTLLTCGRDNVLNVFDVRRFSVQSTLRAPGFRVATNWSRVCLSPDEKYAVAGSADGRVFVWNLATSSLDKTLSGHSSAIVSCVWSDMGRPLATADKAGTVILWD